MAGQLGRKTLGDWQSLSGQDAHSVQLPVAFRDANNGDYRPAGTLPWSLERAATADWGTAALEGVKAPETDVDGAARRAVRCRGVRGRAAGNVSRAPDGTIAVR